MKRQNKRAKKPMLNLRKHRLFPCDICGNPTPVSLDDFHCGDSGCVCGGEPLEPIYCSDSCWNKVIFEDDVSSF